MGGGGGGGWGGLEIQMWVLLGMLVVFVGEERGVRAFLEVGQSMRAPA